MSFIAFRILTISTTITYDLYFRLVFIFTIIIVFSLFGINFWWDEVYVIDRAEYFCQNFSIYFKKKYKDALVLISNQNYTLDFRENEWVEFSGKGSRQKLIGKIKRLEWAVCHNTESVQIAIVQLNLISWVKKEYHLLKRFAGNKDFHKSLKSFMRESSFTEKYDLRSLIYPNDLMKWSCNQYEFLLRVQHKHCQDEKEDL